MLPSPSNLPESARSSIVDALNELLAGASDLHAMAKVAHWNVRGPTFKALHILFDEVAGAVGEQIDPLAERLVTLGGTAKGTLREAVAASPLDAYPDDLHTGAEHVKQLLNRLKVYVTVMKAVRTSAEQQKDAETSNMLQGFAADLEKYGWQLAASLG